MTDRNDMDEQSLIDRLRSGFPLYPVQRDHMVDAANLLEAQEARIAELEECLGSVAAILRITQSPRQSLPLIQFQLRKALFLVAPILAERHP